MALPSILVPVVGYATVDITLPEALLPILALLGFLVGFGLSVWLGSRLRTSIGDLFLAGAVCWVALGIYFHKAFETPGFVALLFGAAGVVYNRFPGLSRHRTARRIGRLVFWVGFFCTFFLYNPLFEGKN
jgi:hypothetical protein